MKFVPNHEDKTMKDTQSRHPFQIPIKDQSKHNYSTGKPTKEQSESKRVRDRIEAIEEKQEWDALWGE
ncbi:hypothetical protein AKJ18_21850 [Vibrio xuii]|nr:hypothetical protein AKJ18_21850 [Vibrio xuii]